MTIKIEPMPPLEIRWNWISVKDRLPPENETVLVFLNNQEIELMAYCKYFGYLKKENEPIEYCWGGYNGAYDIDQVTHWMPLPEPPKD